VDAFGPEKYLQIERAPRPARTVCRSHVPVPGTVWTTKASAKGEDKGMRIIAGNRKGARIFAPKGRSTRPTGDRVREAAFRLIGPVDGATVLDLFAGSGAMGLEALSRGAARAVFVESDRDACRVIERNLVKLELSGAEIVRTDARRALSNDAAAGRRYDLILVDPPYEEYRQLQKTLAIYLPRLLGADGVVVVETGSRLEPELPLELRTSRRYGSARLTVYDADPS